MNDLLEQSYRHCGRVARRAASSFYWSFWLLPRAKRRAMCALYAFSRHTDDLGDNDEPVALRSCKLDQWRRSLAQALVHRVEDPLLPALVDTVRRYSIPHEYLFDVIDGVAMDLYPRRYQTWEELREYCYRVASAVGLACIHIWGFKSQAAIEPAINCGLAFQLTNILRDLTEDMARNRFYLPLDDLRRFDYTTDELRRLVWDERLDALIQFEIHRAEQFYEEASLLVQYLHRDGRRAFRIMIETYRDLLEMIKRRNRNLNGRVHLKFRQKLSIAFSAICHSSR